MDYSILKWISEVLHSPLLNEIMKFITSLGDLGVVWLLFSAYLYLVKKNKHAACFLLVTVALTWVCNDVVLKNIFVRDRPFLTYPDLIALIERPLSSSFPSGHSATSFAAAVFLFSVNKKTGLFALVIALLIGFSRLYVCVHYPTDVLAGAFLGTCLGLLFIQVAKKYKIKKQLK